MINIYYISLLFTYFYMEIYIIFWTRIAVGNCEVTLIAFHGTELKLPLQQFLVYNEMFRKTT
jgi:hypothetical protein